MDLSSKRRYAALPAGVMLVVAIGSCVHSPREPYMDVVEAPPEAEIVIVKAQFPNARFTGPVYRKHMDLRQGYVIVSKVFLFNDKNGKTYRGEFDAKSAFTASPVQFVDKLPNHLNSGFFEAPSAPVPGGRIDGPAWVYADRDPVYEFLFSSAEGDGLGRINDSQSSMSAYRWR